MPDVWMVLGVVTPILVSTAVLVGFLLRSAAATRAGAGWGALAVGGGFVAGVLCIVGPRFEPRSSEQWFLHFGVATVVVGGLRGLTDRVLVHHVARLALALAVPFATMHSVLVRDELAEHPSWATLLCLGLGVAGYLVGVVLDVAARDRSPAVPVGFLAYAAVASVAAVGTGSAILGQIGGAMAAATGPFLVATAVRRESSLARGMVAALGTIVPALLMNAAYFSSLPRALAGLLAVAPLGMVAADLPKLRDLGLWKRATVRLVPLLAVLGVAGAWVAKINEGVVTGY